MLFKKLAGKNYFVALLILLAVTTLLVISVFVITALIPNSLGSKPNDYSLLATNKFEPWTFEVNDLVVRFPEGGIIATLHENEEGRSFLLIGKGIYEKEGLPLNVENPGGLFMVVDDFYFEEVRGSVLFQPIEDPAVLAEISNIAGKQIGFPQVWAEAVPLIFHIREGLTYYYLVTQEGNPILPPYTEYRPLNIFGTFAVYLIFVLILILLIAIFSLDHKYSRYWFHLGKTPPGILSLIMVPASVIIVVIFKILVYYSNWPPIYTSAGYAMAILALIILTRAGGIDYLDLGLRRDRLRHGYFLALAGAILIIVTVRGLPQGFCTDDISLLLNLLIIFTFVALPRELIWRGFIQAVLSRKFGLTGGLFAMIILTAAARMIFFAATAPWTFGYPYFYLELLVLVPGLAAILGYLYLRTENILACALLHSLVLWLPNIILY